MQTSNRLFDDLAKVASGAASTLAGVKQELDALVRQRVERFLADLDLINREEFEVVKATAANARAAQEALETRVAELEARLAAAGSSNSLESNVDSADKAI
ncbi:MAG: accessory factor UbiK family protein [Rhodospirillales bacterium]|nr:accessory factor UbiK family protein [Rhodospirillales bacterium]